MIYVQYENVCISMLSNPLPDWNPAPASLPSFLQYIVQKASEAPSNGTIEPVFTVLTNSDLRMLDSIPAKIIIGLQEQLSTILRTLEDHSASILCLAIFAKLAAVPAPLKDHSWPDDEPDSSAGSSVTTQDDKFRIARKYFTKGKPDRVLKIIKLVVLHALQTCKATLPADPTKAKPDTGKAMLGTHDAVSILKMSADILNFIGFEEKKTWVETNSMTLRKFHDCLVHKKLDSDVRMAAFATYVPLNLSDVPQDLISACERAFEGMSVPKGLRFDPVVVLFAGQFSLPFIQQKLLHMVQLASRQCRYNVEGAKELRHARAFTQAVTKCLRASSTLRYNVLVALSSNDLRSALHHFVGSFNTDVIPVHTNQQICPNATEEEKQSLKLELSALFLRAAIHASPEEIGIDSSLAEALLSKTEQPSCRIPVCKGFTQPQTINAESLSMFQVSSTPMTVPTGQDWRTQLEEGLKRKSAEDCQIISNTVDRVCQDLQKRCDEVERPLREEEAKSNQLRCRLETLELHCRNVETDAQERALILDGLEAERSDLLRQVDSFKQEKSKAAQKYTQLQQKFDATVVDMASAAEVSLEATKRQELEFRASLVAKDEELEQLQQRLTVLESETDRLKDQTSKLNENVDQRKSETIEAEAKANNYQADLNELLEKFQEQRLLNQNVLSKQESELLKAKEDADHRQAEIDRLLQADIDQKRTLLDLKQNTADLQRALDDRDAVNRQALIEQTACHEQVISELQAELRSARANAQCTEDKMQRVIEELGRKCEKRTMEAAKNKALKDNLMNLLHNATDQPIENEACKQSSASDIQASFGSSSSSRSGPTPKRAKPRRSTRTPNVPQPKIAVGRKSVKLFDESDPRSKRSQPLRELPLIGQPNLRPPSSYESHRGKVRIGDENEPIRPNDMNQSSFADSDIFESTNQRNFGELHSTARQGIYDETTIDFE